MVPSSLQMGWTNSPAFFCTGTESTRSLIKRLLALTVVTGIPVRHRHEQHCLLHPPRENIWPGLGAEQILNRVFVDDFLQGLAGEPGRPSRAAQQLWVARSALHAIHSVFPPPDVINHENGKDSVSERKLEKGDARFKLDEVMLGFLLSGRTGPERTVAIPEAKFGKYTDRLKAALAQPRRRVPFAEFQRIHGQMQHVTTAIPCFRGLMTPLNQQLAKESSTVGLGSGSVLRTTFETFITLLEDAQLNPSHITEIVAPDLPHYYGSTDASGVGAGGVWLPCTHWIYPVVWRLEWPSDITQAIRDGLLSMVDCEFAAYFIEECMLEDMTETPTSGISSFVWTDNSPVAGIVQRQASRAESVVPQTILQWLALRQRWIRRGPQDVAHWEGKTNNMADFGSRSFEEGFPAEDDDAFFTEFTNRHPLPEQLGYWTFARPSDAIASAAISLLRKHINRSIHAPTVIGDYGVGLPTTLAKTFSYETCRARPPPTAWRESGCSWPLLKPCGTVTTTMDVEFREIRSRKSLRKSPKSWGREELMTLADRIRPSTS